MKKKLSLVIIVLMCVVSGSLFGQYSQPLNNWKTSWLSLGLGIGNNVDLYNDDPIVNLAMVANYTFKKGKSVLSLRSALCTMILSASVADVGVLYGRVFESPSTQVIVSAGIGIVQFGDVAESTQHLGLPFEVQLFFSKTHRVGLYGFGNINAKKSFYGVCLCLRLGKLK